MSRAETLLAFDTALGGCTVGLYAGDRFIGREVETSRDQARILLPLINDVLGEAGVTYADIDMIVSTVGPGSFTGLRLGLSTARSLSLALDCPAAGVTTFDAMALYAIAEGGAEDPVLVVLETKRADYYAQLFTPDGAPETPPQALTCESVHDLVDGRRVILAGDGVTRISAESGGKLPVSREMHRVLIPARTLIALAREKTVSGQGLDLSPLYLRGADVSVSKQTRRQLQS